MNKARFIAVSRHRIQTDGQGVTTLCGFYGCPLRCKYCINPHSFKDGTKTLELTPQELYDKVKIDDLYFVSTNGGVTFGGGEPLLYADFIREFRALCGDRWHICAETSLNVPLDAVKTAASVIDEFFVDIKDMDPDIYFGYTGRDNKQVIENLRYLISAVGSERITVRIPLIKGINDESDREYSISLLRDMGFSQFDLFEYRIKEH
ncbi:MAG: radical SAM protein [Clostridia bacterium]|nr:radical SAM protein [Clostridia bacterium]